MIDRTGQTIGAYRIEASLGSGGMGQVFRAVHQHLGRVVAIKILHDSFASDSTFQARFLQEAQAAAALEHPNIVQIIDFSQDAGRFYLVLELVPDGSLRSLLQQSAGTREPLPLATGIDLIRQSAEGLAYAHERGMVHRDIKPDNLLLKRDASAANSASGYQVKITDFGLARLAEGGVKTADGTAMGTPAYMSPEQCQGIELDGRSDIYSLGVVLFEVATGLVPFETKTLSDAVFKHVYTPPPSPRETRPDLPEPLAAIILRCLAKRPDERYATARELSNALAALAPPSQAPPPVRPQATQVGRVEGLRLLLARDAVSIAPGVPQDLPLTLVNLGSTPLHASLVADGVPAGWLTLPTMPIEIPGSGQVDVPARLLVPRDTSSQAGMQNVTFTAAARENAALTTQAALRLTVESFAGLSLALTPAEVSGRRRGSYKLAISNAGNAPIDVTPTVRGLDDDSELRFSLEPQRVNVAPGATATVALAARSGPRWFARDTVSRSFEVSAGGDGAGSGGPPPRGTFSQGPFMPFWLAPVLAVLLLLGAAGTAYALTQGGDDDKDNKGVVASPTSAPATQAPATAPPSAPTATAELVVEATATSALPIVAATATEDGSALIATATTVSTPEPTVEPTEEPLNAPIAFSTGRGVEDPNGNLDIYVMSADGSVQEPLIIDPGDDWLPYWSNDGTRIAWVSKRDGNNEIYTANADGSDQVRVTNDGADDRYPLWSFGDQRILFIRGFENNDELYAVDPDGLNPTRLTNNDVYDGYPEWSPDGSQIVWTSGIDGNNEIYVMNADGSDKTRLTDDSGNDFSPEWSSDGAQILWVSDREGDLDIWVMNADGSDQTAVTDDSADEVSPAWSPSGTQVAFLRKSGSNGDLVVTTTFDDDEQVLATDVFGDDPGIIWSPDGTQLAFSRLGDAYIDAYIVNADGTGETRLTDNPSFDGNLNWNKSGS